MRRRTFLRSISVAALVGAAGCSSFGRSEVRMDSGSAIIHPATDQYITNGLQPDSNNRVFATAVADESPAWIGPDAESTIADPLQNQGADQFHVIVQLQSSSEAPISLQPAFSSPFEWPNRSTLRVTVQVKSWGSLDRLDDKTLRKRLTSADELIYTAVWSLTPNLENLPRTVELLLQSQDKKIQ